MTWLYSPWFGVPATVAILLALTWPALRFAPWVGAGRSDIRRALRLAALEPGERFYDLGCGDGRVVFAAARMGARATGVELTWPLYGVARLRRALGGARTATILRGDLFAHDVADADVIYLYGKPKALSELVLPKLVRELEAGTRVVTVDFPMQGGPLVGVDDDPAYPKKIWLYRF
jgi:SAM-dependent methyltransferase